MNSNSHTLTRGNKQFELCNHLGNVLVTVQDRKRSVDVNVHNQADYYLPYLRTVTNYYAYGSAMPGIGGSIKECTVTSTNLTLKKYPYFYTFSNDSTSGFTAGSGARSVTNPTHNVLHLESIWTTRPLANKTIYLKNGVNYALKFNLVGFSVVSGYTHTVKVRILLPGNTLTYTYTATGNHTINFTSNTTGNVTVEISSQITGSGTYGVNPYIDIDNFNLSWDSAYTAYVNTCGSNPENYKYGFDTQEKDNEIAGENNFYTAEFWEYDARIARRWNVDPVFKEFESPYACFGGNPIVFNDVNGDNIKKEGEPRVANKFQFITSSSSCSNSENASLSRCIFQNSSSSSQDASFNRGDYNSSGYIAPLIPESTYKPSPVIKKGTGKEAPMTKSEIEARKRAEKTDAQIKQGDAFLKKNVLPVVSTAMDLYMFRGVATSMMKMTLGEAMLKEVSSFGEGVVARDVASKSGGDFVYRSLTSANAESLAAGNGIFAKAPGGSWTLEQHLIQGSSPKSFLNNPWIATSSDINIARSFSSGNGLIRIDISKYLPIQCNKDG